MANSIFNAANPNITAFTNFAPDVDDVHDAQTGLSVRYHTPRQREGFLRRHPELAGRLPLGLDHNGCLQHPVSHYKPTPRTAALLADPAPVRSAPTKPVVTSLSKSRLAQHESAHAIVAHLLGRPIVRVSIIPTDGNAGHTWNYNSGESNHDDLIILAAGRAFEEMVMGDVFEVGCGGDDEKARDLALKLAGGDKDVANTMLREATVAARALVQKYSSAIHSFAMRLAIKKEILLDEADNEIRSCISAFERKEPALEWQRKTAYARARNSVREHGEQRKAQAVPEQPRGRVIREWNFDNPRDVADWNKRHGLKPDAEPKGHADGYILRNK